MEFNIGKHEGPCSIRDRFLPTPEFTLHTQPCRSTAVLAGHENLGWGAAPMGCCCKSTLCAARASSVLPTAATLGAHGVQGCLVSGEHPHPHGAISTDLKHRHPAPF